MGGAGETAGRAIQRHERQDVLKTEAQADQTGEEGERAELLSEADVTGRRVLPYRGSGAQHSPTGTAHRVFRGWVTRCGNGQTTAPGTTYADNHGAEDGYYGAVGE